MKSQTRTVVFPLLISFSSFFVSMSASLEQPGLESAAVGLDLVAVADDLEAVTSAVFDGVLLPCAAVAAELLAVDTG